MSPRNYGKCVARWTGLSYNSTGSPAEQLRARVVELYDAGRTQRQIATELHISQPTVSRVMRLAGVECLRGEAARPRRRLMARRDR